ncbi:MAG: tagaturonate epimerase family protein [Halanaerobiaceae bacterium]
MRNWQNLIKDLGTKGFRKAVGQITDYDVYQHSLREEGGSWFFMARGNDGEKKLFIVNESDIYDKFTGQTQEIAGQSVKVVDLNHENAEVLRDVFPFTAPVAVGKEGVSLGLGDRLGLASPGHIEVVRGKEITPVLAQQSIRELELTGRTYEDVLDAASWSVFQQGYEQGFGADGDHLKSREEVEMALDIGFTMITLDGSEHIDNSIIDLSEEEVKSQYRKLVADKPEIKDLEQKYAGQKFTLATGTDIKFSEEEFWRIALIYSDMLDFAEKIYFETIEDTKRKLDFELSIDETATPTSPQAHYFVAAELLEAGLDINSLAPRFCGEFQKAIDYIGDLDQFETEFKLHAEIADEFGYKLSIHSGSDKFSAYPIIGKHTAGRVHVKTAGTNWLEAIWIIAENDPDLYRELHNYARENFAEATQYYHVTTDLDNIPALANLTDDQLPELQENEDARQLIHITYGVLLQATDENGNYLFRDRLYEFWKEHEEEYAEALKHHIGRHIEELGFA